ncbi:hypothetical protein [Bdellovibrio svalbardensis]|uniref:Uncharacterized protein n=1 Tax=Bdellovibrio svalbardensis TaxID=2972972 RepID=A0ABT6DMP7_9BACT|nr:hypothetical protein [Bdellovibrio svalbardensis]MDG0817370.1 hypothetical protein [Bdellovibrio svalbardensis]
MKLINLIFIAGSVTSLSWGAVHVISRELAAQQSEKCIQIFHDSKKEARGVLKYLQGFPDYTQYVKSIDQYERGDIEKCQATIYIGSKEESLVPRAFTDDYVKTSKNVAWLGYNIWQLGDQFERVFGLRYIGFALPHPSLGSEIIYKGQSYKKRSMARKQVELLAVNSLKFEILAEIRSDQSREVIPYVVRAKNRFYYADVPAEYLTHTEHASIFADILAEMVGVPAQNKARSISSNAL